MGRAIERRHSQFVDEHADVLAHHLGLAQEWTSAVEYGRRAAERAIALSQFADALALLDRVREWLGRLPEPERSAVCSPMCCCSRSDCARSSGNAAASRS